MRQVRRSVYLSENWHIVHYRNVPNRTKPYRTVPTSPHPWLDHTRLYFLIIPYTSTKQRYRAGENLNTLLVMTKST